jgi:two-component system response regulator ArlR
MSEKKKKKIIIVEDELDYARMVALRLESEGFEVTVANDTYSGTHMVVRGDYDLVVLDLMMPAGGGFALLERVRKFPNKLKLPVVILTGKRIAQEDIDRAKALDVAAIFKKPYDKTNFVEKIHEILD